MIRPRHIIVAGQAVTLYSKNGKDWFSRPADCLGFHRRREQERKQYREQFLAMPYGEADADPDPREIDGLGGQVRLVRSG